MERHLKKDFLKIIQIQKAQNNRKSRRVAFYQSQREAFPDHSLQLFQKNHLQQVVEQIQQQIAKQLEKRNPNKVFDNLIYCLDRVFAESKKVQNNYSIKKLIEIAQDLKISNISKSIAEKMIPVLFNLITKKKYQEKVVKQQIKSQEGKSQKITWVNAVIQLFLILLDSQESKESKLAQFALVGLGSLASNSQENRNYIISLEGVNQILQQTFRFQSGVRDKSFLTLCKIFQKHNLPAHDHYKKAIRRIFQAISQGIIFDQRTSEQCYRIVAHHLKPQDVQCINAIQDLNEIADKLFIYESKNMLSINTQILQIIETLMSSEAQDVKQRVILSLVHKLKEFFQFKFYDEETQLLIFSLILRLSDGPFAKLVLVENIGFFRLLVEKTRWNVKKQKIADIMYQFFKNLIQNSPPEQLYRAYRKNEIVTAFYKLVREQKNYAQKLGLACLKDILQFEEKYKEQQSRQLAQHFKSNLQKYPLDVLLNQENPNGVLFQQLLSRFSE